ncbi:hypothetical protein SAMN05421870_103106 [Streptomyces qinglanensis]|uniref:Uncharacterized protein n=1 Tax=Streptomyces qinglanensis TaxID=943816 RepID=A0A1H9QTH6_9ACTN|nr:hypothetical protein SAMN05421870_103106 [Streptomyces qinglanensis]
MGGGQQRQCEAGPVAEFPSGQGRVVASRGTEGARCFRRDEGGGGGVGPFGVGFKPTDAYPAGYYVVDGIHVTTRDTSGRRHMPVALGPEENICRTLD